MEKLTLKVEGMSCAHCEARVTKAVGALLGVKAVSASAADGQVAVEFDAPAALAQIRAAIEDAGYDVV